MGDWDRRCCHTKARVVFQGLHSEWVALNKSIIKIALKIENLVVFFLIHSFNEYIHTGNFFLWHWKTPKFFFFIKKKDTDSLNSCRSMSITPIISKILEKTLKAQISEHFFNCILYIFKMVPPKTVVDRVDKNFQLLFFWDTYFMSKQCFTVTVKKGIYMF